MKINSIYIQFKVTVSKIQVNIIDFFSKIANCIQTNAILFFSPSISFLFFLFQTSSLLFDSLLDELDCNTFISWKKIEFNLNYIRVLTIRNYLIAFIFCR